MGREEVQRREAERVSISYAKRGLSIMPKGKGTLYFLFVGISSPFLE